MLLSIISVKLATLKIYHFFNKQEDNFNANEDSNTLKSKQIDDENNGLYQHSKQNLIRKSPASSENLLGKSDKGFFTSFDKLKNETPQQKIEYKYSSIARDLSQKSRIKLQDSKKFYSAMNPEICKDYENEKAILKQNLPNNGLFTNQETHNPLNFQLQRSYNESNSNEKDEIVERELIKHSQIYDFRKDFLLPIEEKTK